MNTSEKVIIGAVATVVGASMIGSCSKNKNDRAIAAWENTQGTQGFINLNAVRDAFRENQSVADFEKRVNEIFEGDNLVVFDAKEHRNGFVIEAREDLDGSKSTTNKDDLLFTLQVENRTATLKGAGVNSYYKESWIYEVPADAQQRMAQGPRQGSSFTSSPFFWWWMLSPGWGGYYTPMGRYDTIYQHRRSYRDTRDYRDQVSNNGSFATRMGRQHGSTYDRALSQRSAKRSSYIRNTIKSPGFKQKLAASKNKTGSATRSQMRSSSGARRSGSFSSSSKSSSGSRGYGGFRGSSGF